VLRPRCLRENPEGGLSLLKQRRPYTKGPGIVLQPEEKASRYWHAGMANGYSTVTISPKKKGTLKSAMGGVQVIAPGGYLRDQLAHAESRISCLALKAREQSSSTGVAAPRRSGNDGFLCPAPVVRPISSPTGPVSSNDLDLLPPGVDDCFGRHRPTAQPRRAGAGSVCAPPPEVHRDRGLGRVNGPPLEGLVVLKCLEICLRSAVCFEPSRKVRRRSFDDKSTPALWPSVLSPYCPRARPLRPPMLKATAPRSLLAPD